MRDKEGREWREERARECQKYDRNKKPLSHYEKSVQKIMVESDNKRAEKKGKNNASVNTEHDFRVY